MYNASTRYGSFVSLPLLSIPPPPPLPASVPAPCEPSGERWREARRSTDGAAMTNRGNNGYLCDGDSLGDSSRSRPRKSRDSHQKISRIPRATTPPSTLAAAARNTLPHLLFTLARARARTTSIGDGRGAQVERTTFAETIDTPEAVTPSREREVHPHTSARARLLLPFAGSRDKKKHVDARAFTRSRARSGRST